jgi:hypothetical protein
MKMHSNVDTLFMNSSGELIITIWKSRQKTTNTISDNEPNLPGDAGDVREPDFGSRPSPGEGDSALGPVEK